MCPGARAQPDFRAVTGGAATLLGPATFDPGNYVACAGDLAAVNLCWTDLSVWQVRLRGWVSMTLRGDPTQAPTRELILVLTGALAW